jgi:N-acetylmuramoyl-L-alanine amidase
VLAVCAGLIVPAAHARAHHSDAWAREHFTNAERMREALNGRPSADRRRRDYQRVLNAYRNVYLGAPNSGKAAPSVVAVAETLVEMGRHFDDDNILHEAIEQYKFLRREYPGSKFRLAGLFTIGEIYKDDLNDPAAARTTFQEYLRHYPNSGLAGDARHALAELNQEAGTAKAAEAPKAGDNKKRGERNDKKFTGETAGGEPGERKDGVQSGRLPRVTGIRHWSTPDYTRIAIDVEGDVKFSAQRIARPARIFFDLPDTRLASTLVGKSFDVDDGFLKKVRVAQFVPGRTRIVLEVDTLSEYDAFLLPNPYRLIIDIHGKNGRAKQLTDTTETASAAERSLSSPLTPDGVIDRASPEVKPAVLAHAALAPPGKDSGFRGSGSDEGSSTPVSLNKAQTAVVKKVVDAGDDDDDSSVLPPSRAPKRNPQNVKAAAAKKALSGDLDDESETSDSRVIKSRRNHIVDSPPGATSRATGKSGRGSDFSIREATPTASGDRSLIRALGLKIGKIVIDPGHGGHDTGTIGPNGLEEKDLVLEVGRRLGKLLETRLGAEVVYTRKDDTFIPLETRTAVANQARADLFVSIHANSSHDAAARGVETYYLNFTSSPEALEVAARENAVSEKSIYELQDLVKKIALKEKIEESREFAWDVQQSLHSGLAVKSPAIRNRGVKKAPFIVLIGANMPSILAEISFVSNPTDEHRLATSEYRQRIAESLYRGIAKYANGLSGVKIASKMDKAAEQ